MTFYDMNEKNLKDKLDFFFQEKIKVHIDLKNGTFLNGSITKKSKENVWELEEKKIGKVYIFLKDISKVEQFRGEGE